MLKKAIPVTLTVCLLFTGFAGCSKGTGKSSSGYTSKEQENNQKEIKISAIYVSSKDRTPQRPSLLDQKLKEKFNITVDWQDIDDTNAKDKVSLLAASGEFPDAGWNMNMEQNIKNFGTQGYLVDILEHLDKIPNYKKLFSDEEWTEVVKFAGNSNQKLFYFPTKNYRLTANAWIYRKGAFDELGISFPKTTSDLYDALKKIKGKYPNSIPITTASGFNDLMSGFLLAYRVGNIGWYMDPDSKKLEYGGDTNKYREALKFVSKLYSDGMIDKEFQTSSNKKWEESYAKGVPYIQYSYDNRAAWANSQMQKVDSKANWQYSTDYITADSSKGELAPRELCYLPFGFLISKSASDEKVDRLLQYVNWASTDEGILFHDFGENGVTYELKDNKPVYMSQIQTLTNPSGRSIQTYGIQYFPARHLEAVKAEGKDVDLQLSDVVKNKAYIPPVAYKMTSAQEQEIAILETNLKDAVQENGLKFIMGTLNPNDDNQWNQYLSVLKKAGIDRARELRTGSIIK